MKRVIIGNSKVELFEAIDEMPITRYMEHNKYILIDSGIGSNLSDIDRNIDKAMSYVNAKDKENGLKQLMLLKQSLYFVMSGQDPSLMAFACLISSIDGNPVTDLSPDNLERIIDKFKSKLTPKNVREILEDVKKN